MQRSPSLKPSSKSKAFFIALSLSYAALMLYLLFLQRLDRLAHVEGYFSTFENRLILTPLRTVIGFVQTVLHSESPAAVRFALVQLIGNLVMFLPAGFFLPHFFRRCRRFLPFLAVSAGIIIAIEVTQLFSLLGTCDIDDLLLNLIGMSAGYGIRRAGIALSSRASRKQSCSKFT